MISIHLKNEEQEGKNMSCCGESIGARRRVNGEDE
jgi:hypothetical protein